MRPLITSSLRGALACLLALGLSGCALIHGNDFDREAKPEVSSAPPPATRWSQPIENAIWTPAHGKPSRSSALRSAGLAPGASPEAAAEEAAEEAVASTREVAVAAIAAVAEGAPGLPGVATRGEASPGRGLGLPIAVLVLMLLAIAATRFASLEKKAVDE